MEDLRDSVINFDPSNSKLSVNENAKSIKELIDAKKSKDEFDRIFGIEKKTDAYQYLHLRLDQKTKYLHDQGYYVQSYNPNEVFISDGNIIYRQIAKIESDREELIRRNILAQTLLMVAVYMDIDALNTEFVKENFSSFSEFLPAEDQGYFSGIIERNSGIYYSEFSKFRDERELEKYKSELESTAPEETNSNKGDNKSQGKALTKATAAGKLFAEVEDAPPKAAFISVYIYALITMVGFVVGVIYLFAKLFN